MRISTLFLSIGLASAVPTAPSSLLHTRQATPEARTLVVTSAGRTAVMEFDGLKFNAGQTLEHEGQHYSWLVFKEPNHIYGSNENDKTLRHFTYDAEKKEIEVAEDNDDGSLGVVHLEFNKDKTRMLGSSYGNGTIDVWDTSAEDGTVKYIKALKVTHVNGPVAGRQDAPHQHQAVLDPTGDFFAVNDLGGDVVRIVSTKDDSYEIVNELRLPEAEAGCGPRHGAFHGQPGEAAHHYLVVCEMSNKILSFGVTYGEDKLDFQLVQSVSTFGENPPANGKGGPAAGELIISKDGANVYVTNRLTPESDVDNTAIFGLSGCGRLSFKQSFSTGGVSPRMISFSNDEEQSLLFVTNMMGTSVSAEVLGAYRRGADGSIIATPVGVLMFEENEMEHEGGWGPSFVQEIPF